MSINALSQPPVSSSIPLIMRWLANALYLPAALCYTPVLAYQMIAQRKNRQGWRQRTGRPDLPPAQRPRIWVHAVSLGEINAARGLIQSLETEQPAVEVVISTTTDTGFRRACDLFGSHRVFRYPLDFSWMVARALSHVNPTLIVLMELEVWYNFVHIAASRNIPLAVVNGRLTERSAKRLALLGTFSRSMFQELAWVGAQDETIAERFVRVGTPRERVKVTGSVKWDTADITDSVAGSPELADAFGLDRSRPLWVCGSTGPGEEAMILDAHRALAEQDRAPTLAIVPRKPERFEEVTKLIEQRGHRCLRRSQNPDGTRRDQPPARDDIILGDTMGELRKLYSLADVVFVGRSLVPMGGSDPMEVAALAKPIITGPHMENFAVATDALHKEGALTIVGNPEELASAVRQQYSNATTAKDAGRKGRTVVLDHQGATKRTIKALTTLMPRRNN